MLKMMGIRIVFCRCYRNDAISWNWKRDFKDMFLFRIRRIMLFVITYAFVGTKRCIKELVHSQYQ